MSYVHGFDNFIWIMGVFGVSAGILYGIWHVDEDWRYCDREWGWSLWSLAAVLSCVGLLGRVEQAGPMAKVCLMAIAVYLTVSVVMDSILCQVNDIIQYWGVLGGVVWVLESNPHPQIGISLILFALLQKFVFLRFYGQADGMAFLISALYLAGLGKEADCYLLHMILSYVAMALIQGVLGNISKKGRLIEPVPMLPYISVCFLVVVQPYVSPLGL